MTLHSANLPLPDRDDVSLGWLAEYDWLVTREAGKYAGYAPGSRDDLLQECRIALLSAAEKYDPSLGYPFVSYAATVVGNAARRYLTRELRRGLQGGVPDPTFPPPKVCTIAPDSGGRKPLLDLIPDEYEPHTEWDAGRWAKVLGCLNATERAVVRMRLVENLTYREVGEKLGVRESRATVLFQQAIRRLRLNHRTADEV